MSQRAKFASKSRQHAATGGAGYQRYVAPIGLLLVLVVTFLAYWPALDGTKLWDDDGHITRAELQPASGLYRIWFELGATQQYYPLLHSAFWIEHKLWGDSTRGYHLVNLLWHLMSVVLLYLILTRLKIPGALLAAAIFAVHPVMVESVAWISEQKNTLSGVFYLSAMLVYLKFDESRRRPSYWLALVLFTLGMLTKTVVATLPAALLVIFWWQRGTLSWKRDVLPLVPFFLLGAVGGLMTAWVERTLIGAEGADFELSLVQRGLLAGRVIWFYLGKLVWPTNLIFIYRRWAIDPAEWWQWIFPVAALGVTVGLALSRKRWRGPLAGWLLFVGTLFPVLGFLNVFPFMYSYVADHFQYLASLGMIVLVAAGLSRGIPRLPYAAQGLGAGLFVAIVCALALLSWQQSQMYADCFVLYRTTVERNPECWMAHYNWALQLEAIGKQQEAIEHFQLAAGIMPTSAELHNKLGLALVQAGHVQKGVEHLQEALRLQPEHVAAHNNLGLALTQLGDTSGAIQHIQRALQLRPTYAEAHNNLANALKKAGRLPEAITEYEAAIKLKDDDPLFFNNLGNTLAEAGRFPEACEKIKLALQLQPDFVEAHYTLAVALTGMGDVQGAVTHFQRALQLRPDFAEAHNNLGEVLRRTGHTREAIEHFEAALRVNPNVAAARNNLGIAMADVGEMPQAMEQFRLALQVDQGDANAHHNLATALLRAEKPEEAIGHYEQAVRLRPNFAAAHNGLGDSLCKIGKPEKSIEHYQAALRLSPALLQTYVSLANVLVSERRSSEAVIVAQNGIQAARSIRNEAAAQQIEEWLSHYRTELKRAADAEASAPLPSVQAPTRTP